MARDTGLLALSQYVSAGLDFLTVVVATRWLGPSDYGLAALVMAYPTLLWSFVGTKSVSLTTRYIASFRALGRSEDLVGMCKLGYSLDIIAATGAFLLVSATGFWVAEHIFKIPEMAWLMVAYAGAFPFLSLTGTSWAILSSWHKFYWFAVLQVLYHGVTFIAVLAGLLAGFLVPGMVLAMALSRTVTGLAIMGVATYVLHCDGLGFWWNASLKRVTPLLKELRAFFGWNYVAVTLSGLAGQAPLMILGRLRGPEEAGFYRLATSLIAMGSYMESALGRVVYPALAARWGTGERESLTRTLKRWTWRVGLPAGGLMLLTIPFLPITVPLVFASSYSPMVSGVQVMMVGAAVSIMFFWLNSFYYASGRIALWTKAYGLYTVFIIGLAWFCIQQWGFFGLASVVGLGEVLFTVSVAVVSLTIWKKSQ
jgi:O-antigen/teichoic acid export membrane protein